MKAVFLVSTLLIFGLTSCAQHTDSTKIDSLTNVVPANTQDSVKKTPILYPKGTQLETRINTPFNFIRTLESKHSYASYLRQLPLKPNGSEVMLYDGSYKPNMDVYDAVVDLKIGQRNLHQCADAVMRLRAEYLWSHKRFDDIHFNFTNGFRVDYSKWMQGYRIRVKGNKVNWFKQKSPSNTYEDFWSYMELIFSYAGTLSLSKELVAVNVNDMKVGDVFIWGGSPGHAILVVDMAINPKTKETLFLLAQSYMPAQEIQILKNPNNSDLSPWYSTAELDLQLITPEWNFDVNDLKRFK